MSFGAGFGASTPATQSTFSFGTANSTMSTPVKPTGFGTPSFGFSTPATASQTLFGTPSTQTTGAFGTTTGGNTNAFGLSNVNQPQQTATAFGNTGTSAATNTFTNTGTTFGFGTTPGSGTSTTGTFGTLGQPVASSATTTTGGFGNFGAFGSNNQSAIGTGATATTQPSSLFGNFNTTGVGSTNFGGGFTGFGAKPTAPTTNFGGFGTISTFGTFGNNLNQQNQQQQQQFQQQQQLQQQQQQQQSVNAISEALYNAVFNCQLFNDERDNTIARWNLIQALWGTGKAYYSANMPPMELNQENPLCRFKAIGYSRMPNADNNDGLVVISFNKKEQELKDGKQQLIASLNQILGNKQNLTVNIDNIKSIGELKCNVTLFIVEKGITGISRKIPSNELVGYLTQTLQKQQLTSIGVENIYAQVKFDPSQLKEYLDNPPCSIDPRLWKQAQLDNPNPDMYIPVPMIGFQQVKYRLKCQEEETGRHRAFLDMAAERIQGLQRQHTATQARLKEHRRTLLELQHRVLQVLVRQEISRKVGLSLQPEEEILTNRFEAMHSQISAPTQFKGRISEMLSQLRMRRHVDMQNQERYTMDPIAQDDIKAYLSMEQQGMAQLIDTINTDLESLKLIKSGMADLLTGHSVS
ncbi:hypothetical protein PV326_000609 [Microctonus aethiopoides]|nr:hypothetical protein PV326_000609 [Microctonus aethiopoides]